MNGRMKEVNPKETTRAYAFEMWMDAHMLPVFCCPFFGKPAERNQGTL